MTSKEDIRRWLARGKAQGASHVIVVCDTFDWSDYPVFAVDAADAAKKADKPGEIQKTTEVYNLALDWDAQLNERRAFHL